MKTPPPPPQTIQVQLIPVMKNGTFSKWEMSMNGPPQGPPYPHVPVAAGSSATIIYTIRGDPQANITFASPAISIQAGSGKPNGGVDAQFTPAVNPATVLTLTDTNLTAGPYGYVLYFNNATPLDPIVDNGGPGFTENIVWYALGAVAALILVALVLRPMFRRSTPVERPGEDR